jgi:hypothetical protein
MTALYRGSTRIDGSDEPGTAGCSLPARRTAYRLVAHASRPTELSPDVSAQRTFTSARTDPGKRSPLGLLTVGFHLPLDAHNRAPAGHALTGTVTVTRQPVTSGAAASALSLQVSYDNGRTWHPATLSHRAAGTWSVRLPARRHPGRPRLLAGNRAVRVGHHRERAHHVGVRAALTTGTSAWPPSKGDRPRRATVPPRAGENLGLQQPTWEKKRRELLLPRPYMGERRAPPALSGPVSTGSPTSPATRVRMPSSWAVSSI